MDQRWSIEQLTVAVEQALETTGGPGQSSGRVRSVPDLRTVRYYTTLGLLDPPSEMRGRKALYGRRHLLELVAIKRLQARGMSLAEVQRSLIGANEETLNQLAGLPPDIWQRLETVFKPQRPLEATGALPAGPPEAAEEARDCPAPPLRKNFWAEQPVLRRSSATGPPASSGPLPAEWALHIPVADGVEVVLRGLDPQRLDRGVRAELLAKVERFAEELRNSGLTAAPSASEDDRD